METGLTLGSRERQLGLSFKKLFQHNSGVQLRVTGRLNTITANCELQGALNKFFHLGKLAPHNPSEAYQPDTRLRLGIGAKAAGIGGQKLGADDVLVSVSAKKKVQLHRSQDVIRNRVLLRNYTEAAVAAHYDYNPRSEQVSGELHARVSHAIFRFTEDQDIRLTAGLRSPLNQRGIGTARPYLRVQENCWSLVVHPDGEWHVSYAL